VHHRRVELDHPLGIRQAAIPDARVGRIELDDVHAGDQRIEYVLPFRDPLECGLDARLVAAVLELMSVGRRYDHGARP
jgi:hypothetical protein